MDLSEFATGLLIGLAVGVVSGVLLTVGYNMIREGLEEKEKRRNEGGKINGLALLMAFLTLYLVGLGIFQGIAYNKLTDFVDCQAEYNQQSSDARDARAEAAKDENATLYEFLGVFVNLITSSATDDSSEPPDPEAVALFTGALSDAVQAHEDRLKAEAENPYPPEPDVSCGESSTR